jgi:hypothetical protein
MEEKCNHENAIDQMNIVNEKIINSKYTFTVVLVKSQIFKEKIEVVQKCFETNIEKMIFKDNPPDGEKNIDKNNQSKDDKIDESDMERQYNNCAVMVYMPRKLKQ